MSCRSIKKLKDVQDWQLCCGCGVCAYMYPGQIEMIDIPVAGRRPKFNNASDLLNETFDKGLEVCPGIGLEHRRDVFEYEDLIVSLLKSWGPILEIWEVYAGDQEIRYKGSSGGAITAISLYCLEQEKMHGVLHVVSDPKVPFLNTTRLSKDRDDLLMGIGSRYSPASPCEKLDEIEHSAGSNVVVGKPCDIAAVQKVRKLKRELDEKIGLTIACFCAGTPSTNGTVEMLHQMGVENLNDLSMLRYRGYGWPGTTKVESKKEIISDNYLELSYEESWGRILQKYRQWRCYICPDHTGEFADFAVGDPWYKKIEDGDKGRSLILVRSVKGKRILRDAIAKGYLVAEEKEPVVLLASQRNLQKARARLWGQLIALRLLRAPYPKYKGFSLLSGWMSNLTLCEKINSIFGTMKRVYRKKLKKKM